MSQKVTVYNIPLSPTPPGNITCTVKVKEQGQPDSSAITISTSVIVAPDGSIVSPSPLEATGLPDDAEFEVFGFPNCDSGGVFRKEVGNCLPPTSAQLTMSSTGSGPTFQNHAHVEWDEPVVLPGVGYEIKVVHGSTIVGSDTTLTGDTDVDISFVGYDPNIFTAYVRSVCSEDMYSEWVQASL